MTKREMEQLIDERMIEKIGTIDKKYSTEFEKLTDAYEIKVKKIKDVIEKEAKELNIELDNYHFRCIGGSASKTDEWTQLREKVEKEKQVLRDEAKDLKKRLVIIGLKNKEVASILMQYLGMEER